MYSTRDGVSDEFTVLCRVNYIHTYSTPQRQLVHIHTYIHTILNYIVNAGVRAVDVRGSVIAALNSLWQHIHTYIHTYN